MMEVRGTELHDELTMNDDDKCLASLVKVLSKANSGQDVAPYFNGVVANFASNKTKTLRILSYSLLRFFSDINGEIWEDVVQTVFDDLNGTDTDLQIEALHLIPHLPGIVFIDQIESGDIELAVFRTKEQDPIITKTILECLHTLVLYHPLASCNEKLAEFAWPIICEKLFDDDHNVCYEAFECVKLLFLEKEQRGSSGKLEAANTESFRSIIEKTYVSVAQLLAPRYDTLLEKFRSLPLYLQEPAIALLTRLSCIKAKSNSAITCVSVEPSTVQRDVVYNLVQEISPLLVCNDTAVVYQTGLSIIYLANKLNQYSWLPQVVSAFGTLLSYYVSSNVVLDLIRPLLSVLPNLSSNQIVNSASLVIKYTADLNDLADRIFVLSKVFSLVLSLSVKQGNIQYLKRLMESETVQSFLANDWNSYGEEIVLVATSCCNRLYENHYGAAVSTIMETQQQLAQCICLWDSLDSYVYTQVMNLIDMLGAQHNDDVQPLIGFYMQPERLNNIDDLEKLATILLVIVKHIKKPSELSSLMAVLQVKYQFQDTNQAASLAASAYKDGYLGNVAASPGLPRALCMEKMLHVLLVIYARAGASERKQVITMIAVILEREDNPCIISHCKLIIKRIEAHTKGNLTAFSPHFFPRSALPINTPESNTKSPKYALMSIIANQGYSKAERKQKISSFSQYCDHTWTQIAGSSSPVDVQVAHTLQPELSSVDILLGIRNHTDIPLSNFKVVVSIKGSMECLTESPRQICKTIKLLDYRESVDWKISFLLNRFEHNVVNVRTIFMDVAESEKGKSAARLGTIDFTNEPYPIRPSLLLYRVTHSCNDFLSEWNRFPVVFHVSAKAVKGVSLASLMDDFSNLIGFYPQPKRIWDEGQYFQISSSAISWFKDQISFVATGELDPSEGVWMARFEFRASSDPILSVFRSYVNEWLCESTHGRMFVLDDDAPEDIFNITK
uniref:Uncharacterized protein n=1 Tax=Vannella robusta TaxID=1487602 RepID=A0A7S4HQB2_9EUKA